MDLSGVWRSDAAPTRCRTSPHALKLPCTPIARRLEPHSTLPRRRVPTCTSRLGRILRQSDALTGRVESRGAMRRGDRPAGRRSYALALPRNLWQTSALLRPGGVPSGYVGSGRTGEVREEPIRAWCSLRTDAAGHQKRVGAAEGVRSTRQSAAAPARQVARIARRI